MNWKRLLESTSFKTWRPSSDDSLLVSLPHPPSIFTVYHLFVFLTSIMKMILHLVDLPLNPPKC